MTDFLKHYTLKYTPLSPVHIGADESYEPGNYVIEDGALYGFDTQVAMQGLTEQDRQQLLSIVNAKSDDRMLTQLQAFFYRQREKLIAYADTAIPTASGVQELYQKRIGKTAQHEGRGNRVINKLEIDRTFYNPVTNFPLLPGSSIKGAIRTAMLDKENNGRRLTHNNERNKEMQTRLFDNGQFHSDPFRLVAIGDAEWQGGDQRPNRQIQFAVNRKRKNILKDGKPVQSQAEASNLYQLLECIAPYHYQSFNGSISIHQLDSVQHAPNKLPSPHLQWSIIDIAKACNQFYIPLLQREADLMLERKLINQTWYQQLIHQFENGVLEKIQNNRAFLLRLGRHSGAEALTLNHVRSIKIMQAKKNNSTYEKEPKTWWFSADKINARESLLPFGWVFVEIEPQEKDISIQQWFENGNEDIQNWLKEKNDYQLTLKKRILAQQQKEQERARYEQQKQQEENNIKQAEEARLAAMNPLDRKIEEQILYNPDKNKHDYMVLIEAVENNEWHGDDRAYVLQEIVNKMQAAKCWKENSTKKKPEKDRQYQNTLRVKKLQES